MGWEVSKCQLWLSDYKKQSVPMITGQPSSPTWSPGLGGEPTTAASHNTLSQGKKRFAITTFVVFKIQRGKQVTCWKGLPTLMVEIYLLRVASYVIFLTTLYNIIFWWWSYMCEWNMSVKQTFFSKLLNLSPQTLMSWNGLANAHYVGCLT